MTKVNFHNAKVDEFILGGGGIKLYGHVGVKRALEERQSSVDMYTGISAGSIMATLFANGYRSDEARKIIDNELHRLHPRTVRWKLTTITDLVLGYGLFDLQTVFDGLVKRMGLKPQENLRIVAYNVVTRQPVYFDGRKYDLSAAIAASCAVPAVMRPVWLGGVSAFGKAMDVAEGLLGLSNNGLLVDGGVHHPNPAGDKNKVALISKLGFARGLPCEWLHPLDLLFHFTEMAGGPLLRWYFPDPEGPKNIIVESAPPDIACLSFGISSSERQRMVDYGYTEARKALVKACRKGLVGPLKN